MDKRANLISALAIIILSALSLASNPQILSPQPLALGININLTTTDKVVYTPGEQIKATGSVFDYTAGGALANGTIRASVLPRFSDSAYTNNTTTTNSAGEYTAYLTAPSNPGDYRIKINATSPTESVAGYVSLKVAAGTNYFIELDKTAYAPGDNATATVTVKDSAGSVVPNFTVNATLLYGNGAQHSALGSKETGANGKAVFPFTAPNATGNYIFMANSLVGQTVRVMLFQLSAYITDTSDKYKWMFGPSENASIYAKVTDPNGNAYAATISSIVFTPSGANSTITNFTALATGKYKAAYTIGAEEGTYSVKTTASAGGASVDAYTSFYVSNLYINIEKIESSNTPNTSYTVTLTVKDSSGNLKNGSTVNGTITNSLGHLVASYNASEDAATKRYKISAANPADAGWYKFLVSASSDGKAASTSWWFNVQTLEIKVLTDRYRYSPGSPMSVSIETKPLTTITDLSYEIWDSNGIVGTPSTNLTAGTDLNGTATISLNAPKDSGFYSLFIGVNKKAYKWTGFEVKKYNIWTETRDGTSNNSAYKYQFDNSTPVYLHLVFQTPEGGFVNLSSVISNFSYKLQRLYSYTDNKEYEAGLSYNSSYETSSATVAVLALNTSSLVSGEYSVELKVTDTAGSKEKTYSWFRLGGFYAYAYMNKWQYTSSEKVNVTISAQSMNGSALANVSVRVKSSQQADTWPFVDDSLLVGTSVLNATTDANGTARLSLDATWAYGYHQVQIEAEKDGTKQQVYTGFSVQGFELTATIDKGNTLYPGQQYTITATTKSGDTPISGVNITRTEIRYANNWNLVNDTQQNFGITGDTGSKSYTFTMPSDAKAGWYVIVIKGAKNTESHETNLWVEVKSFGVKYYQNGQYQDWLWLGMVQPGAAAPSMQIKVSQGGSAVANALVKTAYLVRTDVWPQEIVNLSVYNVTNATTSESGIASLSFTVPAASKEGTQLQGGWYAIVLNISNGTQSLLTEPWQSPQMEVRSYLIMLDLMNSRNDWASSLMVGENASVQFRVEYPSNRTGVPNINVSLLSLEYANGTLYRNLTVQRPGNSTRYYQANTTDANGNARLALLYSNASSITESATPDETGQFVLVASAGAETMRRWFDVSSFNTKIDMNNTWEFRLDGNLTLTAHATDANENDITGVLVNISEVRSGWTWNQKTFDPIAAIATGSGGARVSVPLASLNITEPGDYNLRMEFSQGNTRTSQWIWFRAKSFDLQVFPTRPFFVGQALNFTINASSGAAGIAGINATLVSIRDSWSWNVLRSYIGQYNTTTGSNGLGYLPGPSNLSKGFYIAEINVSNAPTFYAWFDVRAFEVNAWSNRWAYQQGENISAMVRINPPSNATVYYTAYTPNGGQLNGNFSINDANRNEIENGNGAQLTGLTNSSGYYQLKLLVSDPTDASKFEERWISYEVRTFDAWVWLQPWQYANGENATANVNVYLGNTPLPNVTASLAGIGTRIEVLNGTSETNMGLTIQLLNAGWGNQPDPMRWQPTEWASANISNSTNSTLFTFNKTSHTEGMSFGQYTIKLDWLWNDWQNNNAPKANFRVFRDHTAPNNITGTSLTNSWGQATLNFPVQSDLKKGSYEPTIRLQYRSLSQDMPAWMEVIPFSYTARLNKKTYNSGENATLNITATQPVNISVIGIMKWGWQPVENMTFIPATKGEISPGKNISLNASGTVYSVVLNNITKDPGSWSSKANVSLYVNGTFNTSREIWQWNEEPVGDVIIKVMNIMGDRAEISTSVPYKVQNTQAAQINFTVPSEQAGYSVSLMLQNGDTRIYDNIWFEVAQLNLWGWSDKWSYDAGDNVTLNIEGRYGGTPANGTFVAVNRILRFNDSRYDWDVYNNTTSALNATINSEGRAQIKIPTTDGGSYNAEVYAYESGVKAAETKIWYNTRLFDAWTWMSNWQVYLGDNITVYASTNPPQANASIEVYEDNMTSAPFVAVEAQANWFWDSKDMPLNGTRTYHPNSENELNITFTSTTKVCGKGKEELMIGELSDATANLTIQKGENVTSVLLVSGNSTPFMNNTIYLRSLDCRPTNHSYHWLANGTTDASGSGNATFNTTRLNDNTSLDHQLEIRIIKNGKTVTRFAMFQLKTFDMDAWFKGKEGWEPTFTPTENMTLIVKTTKNRAIYPNVNVTLLAAFKQCGDVAGASSSAGGSGTSTNATIPTGAEGGGNGSASSSEQCGMKISINEYLNNTDTNGLLEASINKSKYNLTTGRYDLILSGTDPNGNMAIANLGFTISPFSVELSPQEASQGEPITVTIASNYPNGTVNITEQNYMTWPPTSSILANGTLDETGAGTIVISTASLYPGYHNVKANVLYNDSGTMKTASRDAFFTITPYSVTAELDKQTYSPGGNMTVTITATKGGYGYSGVTIDSISLQRTDTWGMGIWLSLSGVTTDPSGRATFKVQAPIDKGDWTIEVKTRDMGWNWASDWELFKVSDAEINLTTTEQILDLGSSFQVNATPISGTGASANLTLLLWRIYDPATGIELADDNITAKQCLMNATVPMNATYSFNCTISSRGLYFGMVMLGNIGNISNISSLGSITGISADTGMQPPAIVVWAKNKNITAVEAQRRAQMNASTATSPQYLTFNLTSNESAWMPFMIKSKHRFPTSLIKVMMKEISAKQESLYLNPAANLTEQAPDASGDFYYLMIFTDRDLTASEVFGGPGIPGDLARLVDIREVKMTYAQSAANLKITSPTQGQNVTDDYLYVMVQKGGNLNAAAGTKVRMDNGANRTYWEGMHLWDFNLTNGQHTLHAWLVNSTNGTINGTYTNVTFNLNRTFYCLPPCGGGGNGTGNYSNGTETVNITITFPYNGQTITSNATNVYYNITSGFGKVLYLGSRLDNNNASVSGISIPVGYVIFNGLAPGYHNVTLAAMNGTSFPANVLAQSTVSFFVNLSGNGTGNYTNQTELVNITIESPGNNTNQSANLTVYYIIGGNHSKVSNVSYRINEGNQTILPKPTYGGGSFNLTNLSPGPNTIAVLLLNASMQPMAKPANVTVNVLGAPGNGSGGPSLTNGSATLDTVNPYFNFTTGLSYYMGFPTGDLGFNYNAGAGANALNSDIFSLPNETGRRIAFMNGTSSLAGLMACPYRNATQPNPPYRHNSFASKNANLSAGDVYCIYTYDNKYAKMQVTNYTQGVPVIMFDWVLQPNGSESFI